MARQMIKSWRIDSSPTQTVMITRISLIISFIFHIILLFAFQQAFPLYWVVPDLRTYRVELIRPPVEDIDTDDMPDADVAKIKGEEKPAAEVSQDTISLDTQDKRYVTYARLIKERISYHWTYPQEAKDNLMEGKLTVLFSLNRGGDLTQITIVNASGYHILDAEATRAIRSAAPFPHFPEHITVTRLNIKATFDYRITTRR